MGPPVCEIWIIKLTFETPCTVCVLKQSIKEIWRLEAIWAKAHIRIKYVGLYETLL